MIDASTRSKPGQNACEPRPVPERDRRAGRAATTRRGRASEAITTQIANLRTYLRTKPTGPSSASPVATQPKSDLPERHAAEAEQLLRECARAGRDDDQLEDRPAEALHDVERGRQVRAAAAERRAQQHHRRHARVGADQAAEPEHQVADDRGGDDRAERDRQRERRGRTASAGSTRNAPATITSSETERFAQSRKPSRTSEHPQALRDRLDSPVRRVVQCHALPSPA